MQVLLKIERFQKQIKLCIAIILLLILFTYTLPWIIKYSADREYSGVDFHAYWYANLYTRQGINPYWAILDRNQMHIYWDPRYLGSGLTDPSASKNGGFESILKLPIRYLDGRVTKEYPVAQVLIGAPSTTAPLSLLMGLFSWFSWSVARIFWLGINIIFAALIPWLGFRLVESQKEIDPIDKLVLAFAFYNFYGLRQSLVVGQQSVICLFLLLLALLVRDRWLLAGLLLGIGISKYSVGLPFFLLFLMQKETRIIVTSIFVQLLGVVLLIPLAHGSLDETAKAYLQVMDLNYLQEGIHLLARSPEHPFIVYLFILVVLIVLIFVVRTAFFNIESSAPEDSKIPLNILNLLTIALFLVVYHRIHDMPFAILFFFTMMLAEKYSWKTFSFSWEHLLIISSKWLLMALLIFPTVPGKLISYIWHSTEATGVSTSYNPVSTVSLLLMFFVSVWMEVRIFYRSRQVDVFNINLA